MARQQRSCDVLIAGGGPAGLAAAIALAERQVEVIVAEPLAQSSGSAQHVTRCEMLPEAAGTILARLDIEAILKVSVPLTSHISRWSGNRAIDQTAGPGLNAHGWSIDRGEVEARLCERLDSLGGKVVPLAAESIAGEEGDWQICLRGEDEDTHMSCRYLIDASGRRAALARRLGARLSFGPKLVAVTCDVPAMPANDLIAVGARLLVETTPSGWWYVLPRYKGGATFGYLTSGSAVRSAGEDLWVFLKNHSKTLQLIPVLESPMIGQRLTLCDSRNSCLSQFSGPGWLATGDAAAAFDPIAAQGLFNALSAGFFAGNAAADALAGIRDAPDIYADLATRTVARTHRATPLQYSGAAQGSPFWARHAQQ